MIAIMSLGHIAFPLSPRNNPTVTAHLLEKMEVTQLFASEDSTIQALAQDANDLLVGKGMKAVKLIPMVKVMDLERDGDTSGEVLEAGINDIADTDVTVILHSSGRVLLQSGAMYSMSVLTSLHLHYRYYGIPEADPYHKAWIDEPGQHPS